MDLIRVCDPQTVVHLLSDLQHDPAGWGSWWQSPDLAANIIKAYKDNDLYTVQRVTDKHIRVRVSGSHLYYNDDVCPAFITTSCYRSECCAIWVRHDFRHMGIGSFMVKATGMSYVHTAQGTNPFWQSLGFVKISTHRACLPTHPHAVNIAGIDKVALLDALVEHPGHTDKCAHLHADIRPRTTNTLPGTCYDNIHYWRGCPIKASINHDHTLSDEYDALHGNGAFSAIVAMLRRTS